MDKKTFNFILVVINLLCLIINAVRIGKAENFSDAKTIIIAALVNVLAANIGITLVASEVD